MDQIKCVTCLICILLMTYVLRVTSNLFYYLQIINRFLFCAVGNPEYAQNSDTFSKWEANDVA